MIFDAGFRLASRLAKALEPAKNKSADPAPDPAAALKNPYDAKSRYPHLKTESGEWKNQHKPFDGHRDKTYELQQGQIKAAQEAVAAVERMTENPITRISAQTLWKKAWVELDRLPKVSQGYLVDRLIACHPMLWEDVDVEANRMTEYNRVSHSAAGGNALVRAIKKTEQAIQKMIDQKDLPTFPLTKTWQKLAWYENRLQEDRDVVRDLKRLQTVKGEAAQLSAQRAAPEEDTVVLNILPDRGEAVGVLAASKSDRRARDRASADRKRTEEELRVTTFELERALGATRSKHELDKAMTEVRAGTFRVGVGTRIRDRFSKFLGGLAGHAEELSLNELVQKHRALTERLSNIKERLDKSS